MTLFFSVLLCASIPAQVTQRVSLSSLGTQGNGASGDYGGNGSISADGRYVAFGSHANNLVPGDTNGTGDVFVRDRRNGTTERVSVGPGGVEGDDFSLDPHISADGRFVVFTSVARNLVTGDANGWQDVFVRDLEARTTERVSVDSNGGEGNDDSFFARISADGHFVVFFSYASNLVPGDTNDAGDIFVRDRWSGTTERVNVSSAGAQALPMFQDEEACDISADGRYVAFVSDAANLVPGDTNYNPDVFVRDRRAGTTERVSIATDGTQQISWNLDSFDCSISPDGRYVGFTSDAPQLVPGDTNDTYDVFVHDRVTHTTERVSVDSGGVEVDDGGGGSSVSGGGRYVAFGSYAPNLVQDDTNGKLDVFVRDRQMGTTKRVSLGAGNIQVNAPTSFYQLSPDGRFVILSTAASNFVPGDTNSTYDMFVRDLSGGPTFTSLCDSGVGGVIGCPCSNAPSGTGRGCDNSSATGGALLSASGGTFLSSDSLVFTTSGEKPTALSIVVQGNGAIPGGVVYGQGVRCLGGAILHRLIIKHARGGSITAPDFALGDSTISDLSAAKGDVIQPGQSRWYLVLYRDAVVLGGCPASSTFNATQTGLVSWAP